MIRNLMCFLFILGICYFFQEQFKYAYLIEIGLILILNYGYVSAKNKEKKEVKKVMELFKDLFEGVEKFKKSEKNKNKLFEIFDKINDSR